MTSIAKVKIHNVRVDTEGIDPGLRIGFELSFPNEFILLQISGRVLTSDNKVVGYFQEHQANSSIFYDLNLASVKRSTRQSHNYHGNLITTLSKAAIDHIESVREKNQQKDVSLTLHFIIKFIEEGEPTNNTLPSIRMQVNDNREFIHIKQSDWIQNFAPVLGIGKYVLLELQIPESVNVKTFWKTMYSKLSDNVHEMELSLRSGDWYKTMTVARRYYENIKLGDNKPGTKKFREEFDKLMIQNDHSKEGLQNLYTAIWQLFEFFSKYIHEKDKEGNHQAMPQSTKEDAYFAYALAVGLLNMIGKKLSDES